MTFTSVTLVQNNVQNTKYLDNIEIDICKRVEIKVLCTLLLVHYSAVHDLRLKMFKKL